MEAVEVAVMVEAFREMAEAYERQYGHPFDYVEERVDVVMCELERIIFERERHLDGLSVDGEQVGEEQYSSTLPIPSSPDPFLFQSVPMDVEPNEVVTVKKTEKKTKRTKTNNKNVKKKEKILIKSITFSNMKNEQELIAAFVNTHPDIQPTDLITDSTTLLVMPTKNNVVKRTFKYMMAVLYGCPVVSRDYLDAAVNNDTINIEDYLVDGDEYENDNIVKRSMQSHQLGEPGLFHNMKFYFYGTFEKPPLQELQALIMSGGGQVIASIDKLSKGCIVLCDPTTTGSFEKDAGVIAKHRPIISTAWIFACISCYMLQEKRDFVVL